MKPFSKWTLEEVEDNFNIVLQEKNEILEKWLEVQSQHAPEENDFLNKLKKRLYKHVLDWNEWELKTKFIMPLLMNIEFDQERYQSFIERDISISLENEKLGGTVDFVVSTGRRSPKHPFFFINEFKKDHEAAGDPFGQLMIAMVTAQKLNNDDNPIYGAYVVGRHWTFVVLHGLEYAYSFAYDATKDEMNNIFGILKNTKAFIEDLINKTEKI